MTTRFNFLAYSLYGFDPDRQRQISREDSDRYAHAVLTIAAADGLSSRERDYFVNLARAMEMPEELAESYASYDTRSATLEDLVAPLRGKHPAPYLLYDAIKIASVDGYTEQEREKLDRAAQVLGVSVDLVRALEGLVAAENALRDSRLALFAKMEKEAPSS